MRVSAGEENNVGRWRWVSAREEVEMGEEFRVLRERKGMLSGGDAFERESKAIHLEFGIYSLD